MDMGNPFFETILDNMHEAIYILDRTGKFLFANKAFLELSGASRARALSYDVHRLLREGFIDFCLFDLVQERKTEIIRFQHGLTLTGQRHTHITTSTPVFDENGDIEYVVAVLLPVSMLNWKYQVAGQSEGHSITTTLHRFGSATDTLIAESSAFRQVLNTCEWIADSDATVLLLGETGVGKEVVAHHIHRCSPRSKQSMVELNCASLPENLLEAELFGYLPGAFTGASPKGKPGLIEAADGGTLFLDEVNSMPLGLQAKLLRVLESKQITRLGAVKSTGVDFRLLSASNRDLLSCVQNGTFREDLYYRLNVLPITIPPLRERREDILPLVNYFLRYFCDKYSKVKQFSPQVLERLTGYDWPGNVRELRNLVERIVVMSSSQAIEIKVLPPGMLRGTPDDLSAPVDCQTLRFGDEPHQAPAAPHDDFDPALTLKKNVAAYENRLIRRHVEEYGSLSKAAAVLGSSKATLSRKLLSYPEE